MVKKDNVNNLIVGFGGDDDEDMPEEEISGDDYSDHPQEEGEGSESEHS